MSGYITMSQFGLWGRWGNCLFEYMFLKCYAQNHRLELQIPPWAGTELLGTNDPPVTVQLPAKYERREAGPLSQPLPPVGDEFVNHDWRGYGQIHTSWFRPYCEYIRSLLRQPAEPILHRLKPVWKSLCQRGETRIGLHLRRGDYGRLIFYITPVQWYLDWLAEHWQRFHKPVLFIATETPSLFRDFAEYDPVMVEHLGLDLKTTPLRNYSYLKSEQEERSPRQMDFYPDFWLLSQCEIVLGGNSTFPFAAAMLNPFLEEFWRSHLPTQTFRKTDPWDSVPLERDHLDDYPDIKGVRLTENPHW